MFCLQSYLRFYSMYRYFSAFIDPKPSEPKMTPETSTTSEKCKKLQTPQETFKSPGKVSSPKILWSQFHASGSHRKIDWKTGNTTTPVSITSSLDKSTGDGVGCPVRLVRWVPWSPRVLVTSTTNL